MQTIRLAVLISLAVVATGHDDIAQAQTPATDGLIHITCTVPAEQMGTIYVPALVRQVIVNPVTKAAWTDRNCGPAPAFVDQGQIIFDEACHGNKNTERYTIDRYTGAFSMWTQGAIPLTGQCVAGQKQLF